MTIKVNRKDTGICGALFYFGNATSGHQKYTVGNARLQEELRYLNTDVKRRFGEISKSYLLNIKGKGCSIKSSPYGICSSGAGDGSRLELFGEVLTSLDKAANEACKLIINDLKDKKSPKSAKTPNRKGKTL